MKLPQKFRALFRKEKLDAQIAEEMKFHLDAQIQRNLAAGMSPDEARCAARRDFGGVDQIKERWREERGWFWLEQTGQDVRYATRMLAKAPGFTATVVATLALGIGACTVIFTVVNSTLLHAVDGPNNGRTVLIHETQLPKVPQMQLSPPAYLDLSREAKSFEYASAWTSLGLNLRGDSEPLTIRAAAVSEHTFDVWGTPTVLGRNFLSRDFVAGQDGVVILSHSLWQRAFGGAADIIGRSIGFDGGAQTRTVVGIMSPRFARLGSDIDAFVPLLFGDADRADVRRGQHFLQTQALLKAGVTLAQAQAELNVLAARSAQQFPATNQGVGFLVRGQSAYINRTLAPLLYILLGAVGCVLLIAGANVANLLLARATVRQREMAVRAALGAGRGRLVRQLLVESVLLAVLGGGAGVLLAQWGLRLIRAFAPMASTDFARLAYVELDGTMLVFTLGFSVVTGLAFGLAPAWLAARVDLSSALKQGTRGNTRGGLRGALVVAEVALALVLLTGAGLLIRSFTRLAELDLGFAPERAVVMNLALRSQNYGKQEQRVAFTDALSARLHALPGVEAVAFTSTMPMNSPSALVFNIEGRDVAKTSVQPTTTLYLVSAEYFKAMGVRLLGGREFTEHDNAKAPRVAVINQTLAKAYFGDDDPLGHRINIALLRDPAAWFEIVGVMADTMQGAPGQVPPPQLYLPWGQASSNGLAVLVRTAGNPSAILAALKPQVYAVDQNQAAGNVRLLSDMVADTFARQSLTRTLLTAFAFIALVIAAVGIYGVMAYTVSQRTTEFGIRMALGASAADVLRLVTFHGMKIVALGLALGLGATLVLGRVVESLLYQTSPRDPATLAAIVGGLGLISLVACLVPARRATKVDPMVALRSE